MWYSKRIIDGFWLKIIGFIFTIVDHVGLMFFSSNTVTYTVLRDMGRIAMPIFVFLAVEGVYYTKNYWKYFLRLFAMGVVLDAVAFTMYYGFNQHSIQPGNIFTDLAFGTMAVYFLKKKNWDSLYALFPIGLSVIACFSTFNVSYGFQNFINFDYDFYGQVLFVAFFAGYEIAFSLLKSQAQKTGLDEREYMKGRLRFYINLFCCLFFAVVSLLFQFIWHYNPTFVLIPCQAIGGMATESWSALAIPFIMLYDGRPGFRNKWARYSMYLFYPVHLVFLWLISLAVL